MAIFHRATITPTKPESDGFELVSDEGATATLCNDRFDLIVHRRPVEGARPPIGLVGSSDSDGGPVVLTEVRER